MQSKTLAAGIILLLAGCASVTTGPFRPMLAKNDRGIACCAAQLPFIVKQEDDDDDAEDIDEAAREQKSRAASADYLRQWDADDNGNLPTSSQIIDADAARDKLKANATVSSSLGVKSVPLAAGVSASSWMALGPSNFGGRIRSIIIDPRNANRIFVGAVSGGIWLSTNGGGSFAPLPEFPGNINISCMAIDPANPNIMYAGTGEISTGLSGIGIFKSVDGGSSWALLQGTSTDVSNPLAAEWLYTNRIAINPANPNIILAGVSSSTGAILRSVDGGISWIKVIGPRALDIKFDPNNPNNAIAGSDNGSVYYSRDAGLNWTRGTPLVTVLSGTGGTARAEVSYVPTQPNWVFVSIDNNNGDVWKSLDGGINWSFVNNPMHLGSQGHYDNAIWVDPTNENHIIVSGLDIYQSNNGGFSFNKVSTWQSADAGLPQPHSDHHAIVSVPNFSVSNPVVYFATDGGLYRANNIFNVLPSGTSTWQNLNNQLAVTQFYAGAGKLSAGGRIIGGTQDNGSLYYSTGTNWLRFAGGDGGFVAVDPVNDNTAYGEYVYASIHRTTATTARQYICTGISEGKKNEGASIYCGANATEQTNFISPFILDPNNRDRMLVGANSLWVSSNIRATTPTWATIKTPVIAIGNPSRHFINAIAVYERDSNVMWVGHNGATTTGDAGFVFKTVNGLATTPVWQRMGAGVLPTSTVNRITVDQDNANRVWIGYSGFTTNRLWETVDGGDTWHSITANLPAVTIHDVKRHPAQGNWLYVATSNGIYTSENGGQSWSAVNDGPSNVRVRELFWYDPTTLIAATYGRSMFASTATAPTTVNYTDLWWNPAENGWGMSVSQHGNTQFNVFYIYDAAGKPLWVVMPGGTWNADFSVYTGDVYIPTGSPYFNYNAALSAIGAKVGSVNITYTGGNAATVRYTINGLSGTKSVQRLAFGPVNATSGLNVGDLWWNPNENGWGINISQQYRTLFAVWYTYDSAGKVTWFVMPGGTWSGNIYSGDLYSTVSSAWLGTTYNPALNATTKVGTMNFNFSDASNAMLTYTVNGITQTKSITRLAY